MAEELEEGQGGRANQVPRALLLAFAPLDKRALGIACGVVCGLIVFLATVVLLITHDRGPLGPNLGLLSQYFWGYSVSWGGALIGLLWGSLLGFVVGWFLALLRNLVLALYLFSVKARADIEQYRDFLDHV